MWTWIGETSKQDTIHNLEEEELIHEHHATEQRMDDIHQQPEAPMEKGDLHKADDQQLVTKGGDQLDASREATW